MSKKSRPWKNGEVRVFAHLLHGEPLPEGARFEDGPTITDHHRYYSSLIEVTETGEERP